MVEGCARAWCLGLGPIEALRAKLDRLHDRLVDPSLRDHPKRPAAAIRYLALEAEYRDLFALQDSALWGVERRWRVLSAVGRALLVERGWPAVDDPILVRGWVERTGNVSGKPGADCPW